MELHWRDVKDLEKEWKYLEVKVVDDVKPSLRIISGVSARFKINGPAGPVCWGEIEDGYYGAWFLRNDNEWGIEHMPVRPITSEDIEKLDGIKDEDLSSHWAKFFANALGNTKSSPLYSGKWSITNQNQYIETGSDLPNWPSSEENKVGFYTTRPLYLDWGAAGNYGVMALKAMPPESDGRVKWWRKKVKEGTCPPALIWFISCLQAYVILDGHSRLRAFQLENQKPKYMVLKPLNELERQPNPELAKRVHESLKEREQNPRKSAMSIHQINKLLIEVYDDRPFVNYNSNSLAKTDFEAQWQEEVRSFIGRTDTDEKELAYMLEKP